MCPEAFQGNIANAKKNESIKEVILTTVKDVIGILAGMNIYEPKASDSSAVLKIKEMKTRLSMTVISGPLLILIRL